MDIETLKEIKRALLINEEDTKYDQLIIDCFNRVKVKATIEEFKKSMCISE